MQVLEYHVVFSVVERSIHQDASGKQAFVDSCNLMLDAGWTAQGGVAISALEDRSPRFLFAQAFTRPRPEDPKEDPNAKG